MDKTKGSVPPQNLEAEASLLGAILIDSDSLIKIADVISSQDFYDPRHQKIYEAINQLYNKQYAIDVLTITDQVKNNGHIEAVGGASYITELMKTLILKI